MMLVISKKIGIFFALALYISLTWGKDSTSTPFNNSGSPSPTPSVTSNQPFLLDRGYAYANNMTAATPSSPAPPAAGTYPTPGSAWWGEYNHAPSSGAPSALRINIYTNPHLCPINFTPAPVITPFASVGQGNESSRACADWFRVADSGDRYLFGVWVNTVPSTNATGSGFIAGTSFYWSIYCFPASNYPVNSVWPFMDYSGTGVCGPATTAYQPNVLAWDSGVVSWPQFSNMTVFPPYGSNAAMYGVFSHRLCPTNYQPYVTMTSSYQWGGDTTNVLIGHGICVYNVVANPTFYNIVYIVNSKKVQITTWNSNWFVFDTNSTGGARTNGYSRPRSGTWVISPTDSGTGTNETTTYTPLPQKVSPNDTGGIYWTLYCYPPGTTPPALLAPLVVGNRSV